MGINLQRTEKDVCGTLVKLWSGHMFLPHCGFSILPLATFPSNAAAFANLVPMIGFGQQLPIKAYVRHQVSEDCHSAAVYT